MKEEEMTLKKPHFLLITFDQLKMVCSLNFI